ncbi:MAG: hypothetical protein CVT65_09120 [Actinobacteria bacterium HGW-Actinobacteria-5]|nr:MAG: hypothetical protein CVT65_09120 [Actinobacteria bacterium HGW-Actinobacteria-5]
MIGYGPRGNLDPEISFELMASATGALMTGYIVRSLANPQIATTKRHLAGFGSTTVREWTAPGYGLTAIVDAFLEPHSDAVWTTDAIAQRRQLWEQTAASLYER